jgi:hypothetical protein
MNDKLDNSLLDYYSNINVYSLNEAIKRSNKILKELIRYCKKKYKQEIEEFDKQRNEYNKKIKSTVDKIMKELNELMKNIPIKKKTELIPASSYSANMNLPYESDVDIIIGIEDMTEDDLLKMISYFSQNGFTYEEKRGTNNVANIHYVLSRKINDIEIEIKLRDANKTRPVILLHKKIDNKIDKDTKKVVTYIKNIYKKSENKKLYNSFKAMWYTAMFKGIKNAFILM